MSELIITHQKGPQLRWQLLATTSAVALAACVVSAPAAVAADRPTIWLEAGYHFDTITGSAEPFLPPLDEQTRAVGFPSVTEIENALGRSNGLEGSISFQPKGSDWIFAVSARYGRDHTIRNVHAEKVFVGPPMKKTVTNSALISYNKIPFTPSFTGYADQSADNSEAHTIIDFMVGKDIGVGLLGRDTDSIVSFGARYAQLSTRSQVDAHVAPDVTFQQMTNPGYILPVKYVIQKHNHASAALAERYGNLRALGPSISMSNTTGLGGSTADGQIALDWGMNAAILFGRQRTKTSHQSTVQTLNGYNGIKNIAAAPITSTRSRRVTIPNLGGFAALSYRFTNAKLSMGYRADFFFGALDRGLDTRQSTTTGYHGPYATFSLGLGG